MALTFSDTLMECFGHEFRGASKATIRGIGSTFRKQPGDTATWRSNTIGLKLDRRTNEVEVFVTYLGDELQGVNWDEFKDHLLAQPWDRRGRRS